MWVLNTLDPSLRLVTSRWNFVLDWVKNNAGWWASGDISESDFVSGIQFLIEDEIIAVSPTQVSSSETSMALQ